MRKLFFTVVVAMFSLLHFTSCEEMIVSSDQTIDLAPKATLSGDVLAELNLQSSGMEAVPAGTELLVEVNYADINPASTGKWMDTIQVSADGKYSVQVPADADGVSVAVTPFSFESDQRQNYSEANYSTIKKAFKAIAFVQPIRSGQSVVRDITYTASDLPTFAYKVAISGKCTANLSAETPGFENAPNGTVIVFYTNDWVDSTTVTNGKYAINAPNKTVTCKSQFVRLKRVWNSTLQNYQDISYKYSYLATYTPTSSTNTYDVDFGEGKDQTILYAIGDDDAGFHPQARIIAHVHPDNFGVHVDSAYDLRAVLIQITQGILCHFPASVLDNLDFFHDLLPPLSNLTFS